MTATNAEANYPKNEVLANKPLSVNPSANNAAQVVYHLPLNDNNLIVPSSLLVQNSRSNLLTGKQGSNLPPASSCSTNYVKAANPNISSKNNVLSQPIPI